MVSTSLTELVMTGATPDQLSEAFDHGWYASVNDADVKRARMIRKSVLAVYGQDTGRLLTDPEFQHKLGMGSVPSYGLTLHHNTMRSRLAVQTIDSCPSAGDCIKVCVLNNNFGRHESVQNGWRWRTDMLAHHPEEFFILLGQELWRAAGEAGRILFRPNVNSDVEWETICPGLTDGRTMADWAKLYGYSKHEYVLDGNGWITPYYHVAYSWNEKSTSSLVQTFLDRGGNVAVCTDRLAGGNRHHRAIRQWADGSIVGLTAPVVDADLGDEWMLNNTGTIGDLGFKPRTMELAKFGKTSDFVVKAYDLSTPLFDMT